MDGRAGGAQQTTYREVQTEGSSQEQEESSGTHTTARKAAHGGADGGS